MFDDEIAYVKQCLIENNRIKSEKEDQTFRNRFEHTIRVLKWSKIISKGKKINKNVLFLSVLFHDIGYSNKNNDLHAKNSDEIWLKYSNNKYDQDFINQVAYCISNHSNKSFLYKKETSKELILLMEADMLDEEGLLGLEWNSLHCGYYHITSYNDVLLHHQKYIERFLKQNPMVTYKAKKIWKNKQSAVIKYYQELEFDIKC